MARDNAHSLEIRMLRKEDQHALMEFLASVYTSFPIKQTIMHWNWQYGKNPYAKDNIPTLVCWDGERIVGQRPLMPFRLWLEGQPLNAVWATDFMVHPDYRGAGIGSKLFKAALEINHVYVAVNSAPATLHIYEKANAVRLPDLSTYIFPHNVRSYLARRWRFPVGLSFVQMLGGWLLSLRTWLHRVYSGRHHTISIVDLDWDDPSLNSVWGPVSDHLIVAERSIEFLRWRFHEYVADIYQAIAAVDARGIQGYAVWRSVSPGRFAIIDVWSKQQNSMVLRDMIMEILRRNQIQPNSEFTQCDASHAFLKRALKACGFIPANGKSVVVHAAASGVSLESLAKTESWYITDLDSDLDPIFQYGSTL